MQTWLKMLIGLTVLIAMVTPIACSTNEESPDIPQRIVSLAPSNTEILFALGLGPKVVGVTDYDNFPPEVKGISKVGGYSTVDLEKVISLSPDLVIADNIHRDAVVIELESRGLKVLTLSSETVAEIKENIALVGVTTGKTKEADQLVLDMEERISKVTSKIASASSSTKPGVFYLTWHDPIWTAGNGTLISELIELAGGNNVFVDIEGHQATNLEMLITRNPDVIIVGVSPDGDESTPLNWVKTEDRLREVNARTNDKIFGVNSDLFTRPGPRLLEGLELLARINYPELDWD